MDDDYLFDDNNKEQEEKQEDNKEDKKDEKPAETEKKEVMDVLMDEEGNEQKEGANQYPISSHFKKIKLVENSKMEQIFDSKDMDHYVETYGIFYCEQNNEIDGETCQPEKLFCKKCTSNIQKLYNLRPNYLINDRNKRSHSKNY